MDNTIKILKAIRRINADAVMTISGTDINTCTITWLENTAEISKAAIKSKMIEIQAEYDAQQYQRDRVKEYPDFKDYLDGIVKGDTAQVQKYIDDCLAVKAKYPKGEQ